MLILICSKQLIHWVFSFMILEHLIHLNQNECLSPYLTPAHIGFQVLETNLIYPTLSFKPAAPWSLSTYQKQLETLKVSMLLTEYRVCLSYTKCMLYLFFWVAQRACSYVLSFMGENSHRTFISLNCSSITVRTTIELYQKMKAGYSSLKHETEKMNICWDKILWNLYSKSQASVQFVNKHYFFWVSFSYYAHTPLSPYHFNCRQEVSCILLSKAKIQID